MVVFVIPNQNVSPAVMAFVLALAGGVMLSVTILEFWSPLLVGGKDAGPVLWYSALGAGAFLGLSHFIPEAHSSNAPSPAKAAADGKESRRSSLSTSTARMSSPSSSGGLEDGSRDGHSRRGSGGDDAGRKSVDAAEQEYRWRLAVVLMASLTAHNFPEGFAVAISALQSDRLGLVVMFAIAMHNVPEGKQPTTSITPPPHPPTPVPLHTHTHTHTLTHSHSHMRARMPHSCHQYCACRPARTVRQHDNTRGWTLPTPGEVAALLSI